MRTLSVVSTAFAARSARTGGTFWQETTSEMHTGPIVSRSRVLTRCDRLTSRTRLLYYDRFHLQHMAVGVDDWLVADSEDEGEIAQLPPVNGSGASAATRSAVAGNLASSDGRLHCRTEVHYLVTAVYYSISNSDGCILSGSTTYSSTRSLVSVDVGKHVPIHPTLARDGLHHR